jgi:hypothetical protein
VLDALSLFCVAFFTQLPICFDFTYFFCEVNLHEVLAHVFIKRGEVKFSWSVWPHYFFREVKLHAVLDFFGEVKWKLVKSNTVHRGGAQHPTKNYWILYKVNRCKLGSLQTSSSFSSSSSSTRASSPWVRT